ncbi:hypothetical protein PInf_004927 [Phytophthora infestans]|nr:hypothetical protein PInf_004927 [Phytophthora infestans]
MTTDAIESKPRKAMNPDRLRKFIDSPSVANASRNVPMAIVKRQTQITSWNGEQCDVRAFEKPKDEQLQHRLSAPLMLKKETLAHAAEIEHRAVPGSVMLKEGIMTPQQRRERLHYETDHLHAKRAMHRADMNARRLHQIMY